jgi:hypothetical protein
VAWPTRLADLLEEHPEIAGELQVLVGHAQAAHGGGVGGVR